jgi:hypothetical protein
MWEIFEVPVGYAVPLTFAHGGSEVVVHLRNIPIGKEHLISVEAIHPGEDKNIPLDSSPNRTRLEITVPIKRGCALVKLECSVSRHLSTLG